MCAALGKQTKILRPGKLIGLWRQGRAEQLTWAGFVRSESLKWWKRQGGELVDVPADRFAERSDRDRQLRWDDIPPGLVVRGLVDPHEGQPLLKIVTRRSTPEEFSRFEHDRMPLLEAPIFSAAPIDVPETESAQGELF
jgi:hypothetical protein